MRASLGRRRLYPGETISSGVLTSSTTEMAQSPAPLNGRSRPGQRRRRRVYVGEAKFLCKNPWGLGCQTHLTVGLNSGQGRYRAGDAP
jgi:hypothetical protein